jgi:hypothetical protein
MFKWVFTYGDALTYKKFPHFFVSVGHESVKNF